MRIQQIAAVLLITAGVVLLWRRPTYSTRQDVLEVGTFKATVNEQKAVPPWIGALAIGVGAGLLVVSGGRRT